MVFLKETNLKSIREKVRIKRLSRSSSSSRSHSHVDGESVAMADDAFAAAEELTDMDTVENAIFSKVKTPTKRFYVNIGRDQQIWTLAANTQSKSKPVVLVHGFCGGIGFWVNNIDYLAQEHPVYAFDLLGFGRSSRSYFSENPLEAEMQFVDAIEKWRKQMGLKDMILMGHSFGGFLSMSYAIKYGAKRVSSLVMIDSWGLGASEKNEKDKLKVLVAKAAYKVPSNVSPSNVFRASGNLGIEMFRFLKPTYSRHFQNVLDDPRLIYRYIYHANKPNPTGEEAFKLISDAFYFAKYPMINRYAKLSNKIPVWFFHGANSFIDYSVAIEMTRIRSRQAPTKFKVIEDGDHQFYAAKSAEFHSSLGEILK